MVVLSFDTSTTITGYAVYNDNKLVHYSSIDKSYIKDSNGRMMQMINEIYNRIDQESPNVVVAEETVVPRNPQTQRMLTMILGAIFGYCIQNNIHYCSLRPTQWRSAVRDPEKKLPRKREELKEWSVSRVNELFEVKNIDDNVSDAILIGMAFVNI